MVVGDGSSNWLIDVYRRRERVDEFVDMPSNQSKTLIITEHRDSLLAQAIAEKYPELVNKSEVLARSRGSFMKSRYKSPRHKKSEQNVEIHVATPPPKQRDDQSATMQDAVSSEAELDIESVATAESTRREKSATSRRLFVDTNTFDDLEEDEIEKKDIPEVFDGSQMHGYRSTSVMQETEVLAQLESAQISLGEHTILSQTAVARTTTASSIDEVLPHPGVTKLKESKIPSPLNRSPSFLSKKRLESPTGTGSSPHLRPSLLPRLGSFSLKSQGGSGTSTPVAAAIVEEEKIEPKPLSASDEFFSKPIPSSMATPTPPLQPADNVTIRPKRRAFFNQEQEEESSPQVFSPVQTPFEAPVEESTQSLHVDTTPEGHSSGSPLDEETATPLREKHYADYTSDDVDELSHLTEGSDQVESDTEWNRHRLDESESRSENDGDSVHGDADQAEYRGGDDAFPDDWRLEGPRHQFDFEDEIGNRLSDDEAKAGSDAEIESTHVDDPHDPTTEWLQQAESSPKDELSMSGEFEEEECQEEVKPDSLPKDTLEALLSVRDEMTRLRAITRKEEKSFDLSVKEQYAPAPRAFDSSDTAEQSQQQSLEEHEAQPRDEPERPYLARLQNAERFARSPLLAPPTDDVSDELTERNILNRLPSLERFGQMQPEAITFDEPTFDDYHESSSEHDDPDLLAHSPSPPLVPEQVGALIDSDKREEEPIDFVKEFRPAEIHIPRVEPDFPAPQATTQPQEAAFVHEELEHAGRFDAAEKLFAAKKTPPPYGYYDRPHSPEPELYMHSEPYHERLPPTQMGAILNPVMSPTPNVVTEDPSGDINAAAEEAVETPSVDPQDTEAAPQPDLQQTQPETSFAEREPTLPMDDENKPEDSPLNAENVARPVSPPQATVAERNAPPATLGWASSIGISVVMLIAAVFCIAGILHAARTVSESREYHQALKSRIDMFEASIVESHEKVLKLEEDYAIWSDYVRKLTQDDEANALRQLEAIQIEVQKWQQDMKADLVQFRQALSVDSIEAAFADLRANKTKQTEQ